MKKRVMVAMSGGVDSSVAAAILLEQGYDVAGMVMDLQAKDSPSPATQVSGEQNSAVHDAQLVADHFGIELVVLDMYALFKENVIDVFVREYQHGRTPNPCILCNRHVKFGFLLEYAQKSGYEYLATGHYAQIENNILLQGIDHTKDQAYFLYVLYGIPIDRILFPIGRMKKSEVRAYAHSLNLPVATRKESQDICFIPDGDYARFLRTCVSPQEGPIVNNEGKVVGKHDGIYKYTIGQRKGLGAFGQRMFVKEILPEQNTIVIAEEKDIRCTKVEINNCVIGPFELSVQQQYQVRVRYRTSAVDCTIEEVDAGRMVLALHSPVRGVAPGQAAVLYDGNKIVGGGTIVRGFA